LKYNEQITNILVEEGKPKPATPTEPGEDNSFQKLVNIAVVIMLVGLRAYPKNQSILHFRMNHRGHREHRDMFKNLCALCVLCGFNFSDRF